MPPDARRTRRPRTKRYEAAENLSAPTIRQETAGRASQSGHSRTLVGSWVLNPRLAFVLLFGVGIATFRLKHDVRLTLIWLVLLAMVLLYAESGRLKSDYSLRNVARGAVVGVIVALPFSLFQRDFFYATAAHLYSVGDLQVLVERAVFLVPILEGCFFRGMVQREKGLLEGALLFGLAQGVYFITAVNVYPSVIAAVVLGLTLLGLLYGYLYQRYGLTASISCHVAVNSVLFVLPVALDKLSAFLV
ncbi:MAG: CPBP family glutamic-type intramembrane protease [Anaerolineae bacterium]